MKSRKSFLSLGIIVIVLFLGVGYAVVSSVYLNIGGTASVANADLKVEITNVVASTSIVDKTLNFTNQLSNNNLDSNFTLNGMELNEVVTITYTVTNNENDVDAELSLANGVNLTNTNSDYFNVDYEITDSETDLENNDKTMEVVVTVELIQTPITESEGTTTVGLKLTASPKGSSNSDSSDEGSQVKMYSYNGVVLPEIPESSEYPYSYIFSIRGNMLNSLLEQEGLSSMIGTLDVIYIVHLSTDPYLFLGGTRFSNQESGGKVLSYAQELSGVWYLSETGTNTGENDDYGIPNNEDCEFIWTNTDLIYKDGSIHLAASDPILVQ